jgi:hypothetical protein
VPIHQPVRQLGEVARLARSALIKQETRVVVAAQSRTPRMRILRGAQQGMMYPGSCV